MKKLILILIVLWIASVSIYAQPEACVWESALDTTGETDYFECVQRTEFFYLTITLSGSSDTVTVWAGTNKVDSVYTAEDYNQIMIRRTADWEDYSVITGNVARHKYILLAAYKLRNIMLKGNALSDTTTYTLEAY